MTTRALFSDVVLNRQGNGISGASITVYDVGTTNPVAGPIYDSDGNVTTNPLLTDSKGRFVFYLDNPQRVDLLAAKGSFTDTVTVDVQVPDEAVQIPFSPTVDISATDVQAAIEETYAEVTAAGVTTFNGRSGAVVPIQADYDAFFTTPAEAAAAAPVQSVFGRTGAVVAAQADYDGFFLTPAEGNAAYLAKPALTDGSVLFAAGGQVAQDNSNLFWDDTNNRLGIGTAVPKVGLHVLVNGATGLGATPAGRGIALTGNGGFDRIYFETPDNTSGQRVFWIDNNADVFNISSLNNDASAFVKQNILAMKADGSVVVGSATPLATGGVTVYGAASQKTAVFRANATTPGSFFEVQNSVGTPGFLVANDGNTVVGFASQTPLAAFTVHGAASLKTAVFRANATTPGNIAEFQSSNGFVIFSVVDTTSKTMKIDGSGFTVTADILQSGNNIIKNLTDDMYLQTIAGKDIILRPTGTEAARLTAAGELLVGTPGTLDSGVKLQVQGAASEKTVILKASATSPGNIIEGQNSAGDPVVQIKINPTGEQATFNSRTDTSARYAFAAYVAGDANDRIGITAAGNLVWGSGAAAADTILFRTSAHKLVTGDNAAGNEFAVNGAAGTFRFFTHLTAGVTRWATYADNVAEGGANAGSDLIIGAYNDAGTQISQPIKITRSTGLVALGNAFSWAANSSGLGSLTVTRAATGNGAFQTQVTGDAVSRLVVRANGDMLWSDGTNTADVQLGRIAADQLALPAGDQLLIGMAAALDAGVALQVQGQASEIGMILRENATTPGNILELQKSDGTIGARFSHSASGPDQFVINHPGTAATFIANGSGTPKLQLVASAATHVPLQVKGAASQSGDLFQAVNSSALVLCSIGSGGLFNANDGTVGFPGVAFLNDNDNGFYRIGTNNFAASVGGSKVLDLKNNAGTLQMGFYGAAPANKPAITGSRGGNAALADLLTQLATLGLITDSTTV